MNVDDALMELMVRIGNRKENAERHMENASTEEEKAQWRNQIHGMNVGIQEAADLRTELYRKDK